MRLDQESIKPIYVQIAEAIEDDIISGKLEEGSACYSQLVIARELGVNPATAGKGINHLVMNGILLKQRGQAMTIVEGAKKMIVERKKKEELGDVIHQLVDITKKLGLKKEEVMTMLTEAYKEG
ncbi:transcriptional regulator, GntR family [Lachnospiraceae bacterium KM106-2]|nr:transcriptional regulator, GntR family [Lachnospiraceae bacterium KM106-2]